MKHDSVEFHGRRMDYCCFGDGARTLVMLPGMSLGKVTGAVALLQDSYSALCRDFTVYLFDRADDMPDGYSTEQMAEETFCAMKALGLGRSCLVGCSQGGMIAQLLAMNHPEAVDRVVLASSAARMNSETRSVIRGLLALLKHGRIAELTDSMAERMYTPAYLERTGIKAYFRQSPPTGEDQDRFRVMAEALLRFDVYDRLGELRAPTLVIGVENDEILRSDATRELAQRLDCDLILYRDFKHAVYDEAPDYVQTVLNFLQGSDNGNPAPL